MTMEQPERFTDLQIGAKRVQFENEQPHTPDPSDRGELTAARSGCENCGWRISDWREASTNVKRV